MAKGFRVQETVPHAPAVVWRYLTDFAHAEDWMTGVESMTADDAGPLRVGQRLRFKSRGKTRLSEITGLQTGNSIALTSTQGGITATYTYHLEPDEEGTRMTLTAVCSATGGWKLLHPLIVFAMRRSDGTHLEQLREALRLHLERSADPGRGAHA